MSEESRVLATLGTATVHEAGGCAVVDLDLIQIIPDSRAAGPARTVMCGQSDNLMVHAAMASVEPGEILVVTMPEPLPIALVGELLATQALRHGAAALIIDGAVRDTGALRTLGLPIWARWVRVSGATKERVGALDVPVTLGGATVNSGDIVILDADGAVVVPRDHVEQVLATGLLRQKAEESKRLLYQDGALSVDLLNLRPRLDSDQHPGSEDGS